MTDTTARQLPPDGERELTALLMEWAAEERLPAPALAQIRRAVLADDAAYEPLTAQWWQRVLRGEGAARRRSADVRTYLVPLGAGL